MHMNATYSPDDNKLRLYASSRLDKELYDKVRAAGFAWAPKQELFVAPMWTPEREDLLLELCEEIEDEDKTLTERAEERADRFEDYSEARASDANRAHAAVSSIADGIPFGQPILVGHHSEKHARRDAEKIENGMRRAVKMWETSKYWEQRAAGALRHAKYKELPSVRARRIKKLEAELRKQQKALQKSADCLKLWESCKDLKQARVIVNCTEAGWLSCAKHPSLPQYLHPSDVLPFEDRSDYAKEHYPTWTLEQVKERARQAYGAEGPNHRRVQRWVDHFKNRIAYEWAMLGAQGGTVADRTKPEKGGACRCWASPRGGGWSFIQKVNKVSVTVLDTWDRSDAPEKFFTRTIELDKLSGVMTAAQVAEAREAGRLVRESKQGFYIADAEPPAKTHWTAPEPTVFDAMKDTLKAGVQVVAANQLFPTPPELARRLVELAGIQEGQRVLEPSAGTGRLVDAIAENCPGSSLVAVEINSKLHSMLAGRLLSDPSLKFSRAEQVCGDFLEQNGNLGTFDRIVMNPPFERGDDIKHIRHALHMLKPGGRLVAICANGPRQREDMQAECSEWIDLGPGAFQSSGTNVNAAIVVFEA